MTWNIESPSDDDLRGSGASAIRMWKTDIQAAFSTDGVFPGVDASNPVFIHTFKSGSTAARPAAGNTGRWYYNSDENAIQRDNGTSWDNLTSPCIPSGKKTIFFNSSAPVGWTQDTTLDDLTVRITTGTGAGTGGTDSISFPPTHNHGGATGNPNINLAHAHPTNASTIVARSPGTGTNLINGTSTVATTTDNSTDLPHSHSITSDTEFIPKYLNVIVCYR